MCESQLPTRVRNNSQDLSQTRWHHPHSSRKGGKPSAQLLVPAPRNIPGVFLEAEHPSEWLIPRYLQGNNFSSLKEWCSLLADLFIQLRFSNSCHGLGLGLIPRRTVSKRVTAAGNVQRGLFYLEKGDVRGFFFFFFGCCCCNYTFYVSKLKKSRRHQKTIRRERARLTKARGGFLFFF